LVIDNDDAIDAINWNHVVAQDARSRDGANLGKVRGLFEPLVIIEKGSLKKENYYIPKSLIERYDGDVLYFRLTEEQVKICCMRDSAPSDNDIKQIQINTERLAILPTSVSKSREHEGYEEELGKLKTAANEFKELLLSSAKSAKEKIKQKQAQKDAQKISKMGELATRFANSFDEVMSEISRTRTYAEQEQIYKGFLKLLKLQRELVVARRDLASKLKGSVTEQISTNVSKKDMKKELGKRPQFPKPAPQLPSSIPQSPNIDRTAAEASFTEIPSAEIKTKEQEENGSLAERNGVKEKEQYPVKTTSTTMTI
jgi:hypothetical protein